MCSQYEEYVILFLKIPFFIGWIIRRTHLQHKFGLTRTRNNKCTTNSSTNNINRTRRRQQYLVGTALLVGCQSTGAGDCTGGRTHAVVEILGARWRWRGDLPWRLQRWGAPTSEEIEIIERAAARSFPIGSWRFACEFGFSSALIFFTARKLSTSTGVPNPASATLKWQF